MGGRQILMLALMALVLASAALAEVPQLLNYQALLKDSEGDLLPDGNYSVTFRIWDAETDGDTLWTEGRLITVQNGLCGVLLGAVVPIPDSAFDNPDTWLGVQIGLDPEMIPRSRLVSVPYARHSRKADQADTADHSLDKTIDASELITGDLDTARFSAFEDLISENKVGDQVDQVAAGEHVHPPASDVAGMFRMEDTGYVEIRLTTAGTYTLKSVSIPPGEVGDYLKAIYYASSWDVYNVDALYWFGVYVDGAEAHSTSYFSGMIRGSFEIIRYQDQGNRWEGLRLNTEGYNVLMQFSIEGVSPSDGVEVSLRVTKLDSEEVEFRVGNFIVIYDKD